MAVTGPRSAWPCIIKAVGDKADAQCGIGSLISFVSSALALGGQLPQASVS